MDLADMEVFLVIGVVIAVAIIPYIYQKCLEGSKIATFLLITLPAAMVGIIIAAVCHFTIYS